MAQKALLVANWEYADKSNVLTPLKGPRNDLPTMHQALTDRKYGLFNHEHVICRKNLRFSELPTVFSDFLEDAQPDDNLLLYFSGHGERDSDQVLVLCGVDTDHRRFRAQCLPTGELRKFIEVCRASCIIVILDCCYAGQMKGGLNDQTLADSLGAGTMVLSSGANDPSRDAVNENEPSPFTGALAKILIDPAITGDDRGFLTDDNVYDQLMKVKPPLSPPPHRNAQSQGTFALARRGMPATPKRYNLKGFRKPVQTEVVDVHFETEKVIACLESGQDAFISLAALDHRHREAIRRLGRLADAVAQNPQYTEKLWYQHSLQDVWNYIGASLFEAAIPLDLREYIRIHVDKKGKRLIKIRLSFWSQTDSLETYPWEYLQLRYHDGAETLDDESLPLALRPGLLIERTVRTGATAGDRFVPLNGDDSSLSNTAPITVGIVNCWPGKFVPATSRITKDLTELDHVKVIIDSKTSTGRWGSFLDAISEKNPNLLLMIAPVRCSVQGGVEVGFVPDPVSSEPIEAEWYPGHTMTDRLSAADLSFAALVFVTFAARPGEDSFRGTYEFARVLANSGIGPVVFICHFANFEAYYESSYIDAFPVLLVHALSQNIPLDEAFYYAKDRIRQIASQEMLRSFGVPGYYVRLPAAQLSRRAPPVNTQSDADSAKADGAGPNDELRQR